MGDQADPRKETSWILPRGRHLIADRRAFVLFRCWLGAHAQFAFHALAPVVAVEHELDEASAAASYCRPVSRLDFRSLGALYVGRGHGESDRNRAIFVTPTVSIAGLHLSGKASDVPGMYDDTGCD